MLYLSTRDSYQSAYRKLGRRVTICAGLQLHRSEKAPLLRRSYGALFGRLVLGRSPDFRFWQWETLLYRIPQSLPPGAGIGA